MKACLNRVSNSQPPGQESDILTEPRELGTLKSKKGSYSNEIILMFMLKKDLTQVNTCNYIIKDAEQRFYADTYIKDLSKVQLDVK